MSSIAVCCFFRQDSVRTYLARFVEKANKSFIALSQYLASPALRLNESHTLNLRKERPPNQVAS